MSSQSPSKPERAPRACQRCRTQKIRCDGFAQSEGHCSQCSIAKVECIYVDGTKRKAAAPSWYVENIEDRLEKMEALIKRLHPGEDFSELEPPIRRGSWKRGPHFDSQSAVEPPPSTASPETLDLAGLEIDDKRHYGQSSNNMFVLKAVADRLDDRQSENGGNWRKRFERVSRENMWDIPRWQRDVLAPEAPHQLVFPPDELFKPLIDNYFRHENVLTPILHRPTFDSMVQSGLHKRDQYFGGLVLLVCACGARWSNDRRARVDDSLHSSGWNYYAQVHRLPRPITEPVTLVRFQLFSLMLTFLSGTCLLSLQWSLVGIALRMAVDVGAHIKTTFISESKQERELWKRCFWSLFIFDQTISSSMGRTFVIQNDDIHMDLPEEVDDQYWYHVDPSKAFVQPPGVPSSVACFSAVIRLIHLMPKIRPVRQICETPYAGRYRYTAGPTKTEDPESALQKVAELDSALNMWMDLMPAHLLWDPKRENPVHFAQSAMVHALYYQMHIIIHRSFIPSQSDPLSGTSPSLALCANAARSCARVLRTYEARIPDGAATWVFSAAFNAGVILLLNIWGSGKPGKSINYSTQLQDVHQCMQSLSNCEQRWAIAGQLRDVLRELSTIGDFPLPAQDPPSVPGRKRPRPDDDMTPGPTRPGFSHEPPGTTAPSITLSSENDMMTPLSTFLDNWPLATTRVASDADPLDSYLSMPDPLGNMDSETLLQVWPGTTMGAGWNIWEHFLSPPIETHPPQC